MYIYNNYVACVARNRTRSQKSHDSKNLLPQGRGYSSQDLLTMVSETMENVMAFIANIDVCAIRAIIVLCLVNTINRLAGSTDSNHDT